MNDDPKWDELENYLRGEALLWFHAMPKDETKYEWPESDSPINLSLAKQAYDDLVLHLGPQVEADEWPEFIE